MLLKTLKIFKKQESPLSVFACSGCGAILGAKMAQNRSNIDPENVDFLLIDVGVPLGS